MTDVVDRLRAADPARSFGRLVSDAELLEWREAGLRQVLSQRTPAVGVPVPSPLDSLDSLDALAVALAPARPADPEVSDVAAARRQRGPRRRRWWVAAAGVAAAAVIAVATGLPGRTPPAAAATPAMLHYAQVGSATKAQAEALALECVQRQRSRRTVPQAFTVRWREWSLGTRVAGKQVTSAVVPVQVSLSRRADGSAELVRRTSTPEFPDRQARERWDDEGRPAATPVTVDEQRWAPGGFQPEASSLPDDPSRLLPALTRAHPVAELGDAELIVAIADAYRSAQLSGAQQAALFRLAATRVGIEPLGSVIDRAGRHGYALSVESDHTGLPTRYTAVFDPGTGRLLDVEQTLTRTAGALNVPVPSTIAYTVFE
ncbi:MAG TPA: hypothetical protein VFL94_03375 [Actinomycetales bacterium]|nr:hypothetical protein [Actinomycetales bacterium]